MPYPRPVSPIGLETCSPPASEIGPDDLLGSDDELDDAARAAKRQRIERQAESYLQGRPLFILSASLRGPFDRNWVNPWKTTRKSRRSAGSARRSRPNHEARDEEEPVIQETDLRHRRHQEDVFVDSRRSEVPASSAVLPNSIVASARDSSSATEDQSFVVHKTVDWLRKVQNRTNFQRFDPPSSPTATIASCQSQNKARRPSLSPTRLRTPRNVPASTHPHGQSGASTPVPAHICAVPVPPQRPSAKLGQCQPVSPDHGLRVGSSFRVASSSSQLPRFEYRRRHQPHSTERASSKSAADANIAYTEQLDHVEGHGDDDSEDRALDISAQTNTCDKLPSAQEVSVSLAVSDRITSLHSTALPREDTEKDPDTSADTQLSTQAALLHAQKSFQNDLESPGPNEAAPDQEHRTAGAPSGSLHRNNITPFYRIEQSDPAVLPKTLRAIERDQVQGMSTQCIIEAATPYTFSTAKKTKVRGSTSPQTATRSKKQKTTSFAVVDSPSPEDSDDVYQTAQSTGAKGSPCVTARQPNNPSVLRSGTQATTLPLELSASTPATAQDGQGAIPGAESFSLTQAIADAGSWLQQSFDFMREAGLPSQNVRGASSSDAPHPAADVDLPR